MYSYDTKQRAQRIRLLLSDVDGVLTDGGVFYGADGEVMKQFNIRDGMGVERLREAGVEVGFITGEASLSIVRRAEKLKITRVYLEAKKKKEIIERIVRDEGILFEEIAYIGDDVNDLDAMAIVGLAAAPFDAFIDAREVAHYVCNAPGGHGAFREFAEVVLEAKGKVREANEASVGFGL